MKKQLISLVLSLLPMVASAYDVEMYGICYNLDYSTRTAEVVSAGNTNAYTGEMEIVASIINNKISYSVTSIGANAFKGCTKLTGLFIPSTVKSIGEDAFFGCTGLKYIISMIENPFEIPKYTFYYNSPSEGVKPLPCMLFVIGGSSQLWNWKRYEGWNVNLYSDDSEFSDIINGVKTKFRVVSVKDRTCKLYDGFGAIPTTTTGVYSIPESTCGFSVKGIGYGAFMNCSGLTDIIIPKYLNYIELIPFLGCTGLTSITIPSSIYNIEGAMFKNTNITEVRVDGTNSVYDSRDNCNAIIKTSTNTLVSGCKATTIPSSVTAIGDLAFEGIGIESVDIPEQLTVIGSSAFRYCDKLTSITIPSGVTTIGSAAFQYCDNLSSVTMKRDQPIAIDENTFSNRTNATLYVPFGSKAAYEAASYWKEFKEIKEATAKVNDVFSSTTVEGIDIIYKVTSVSPLEVQVGLGNGRACINTSSTGSLTIPSEVNGCRVTRISDRSFWNCSKITTVKLPEGVTTIENSAFATMPALSSVTLPDGLTTLYDYAFNGCSALTSVVLPESVTNIGGSAFIACFKLTEMTVPKGVTTISDDLFRNCQKLSKVTLLGNVSSIGNNVFTECSNLSELVLKAMVPPTTGSYQDNTNTKVTLYVPIGSKAAYEAADYWKDFKEIVELPDGKCDTPVITYENGKFKFSSSTEGASFKSTFAYNATSTEIDGSEVAVPSTITFHVSVYATKDGYENSDIATKDIEVNVNSGKIGDLNNDGKVTVTDSLMILDMILEDKE